MHRACGSTENAVEVWGLDTYCYYYVKIIKKDIDGLFCLNNGCWA
jgi:hypothetical protein